MELNTFVGGEVATGAPSSPPTTAFFMDSYFVEVEATVERLADLDLGGPPRRVIQGSPNGDVTIALVRDPDGVRVLLTPGSITHAH